MKTINLLLTLVISTLSASAYWPIRPGENLAIRADSTIYESYCSAQPAGNGNILVIYQAQYVGICYQILDLYGQFLLPVDQNIVPGQILSIGNGIPLSISDGNNGVYVVWETVETNTRLFAQHIDSMGTRLWGDSGIVAHPLGAYDFNLSLDNTGGLYIAVAPGHPGGNWTDLNLQHINSSGNLLWGENGILLNQPNYSARYPKVSADTSGGCFVVWEDWRPPYSGNGSVMAQHIDYYGNIQWSNDLCILTSHPYSFYTLSDESGGFILQSHGDSTYPPGYNYHRRIDGLGNTLWIRRYLSWGIENTMVAGEPGFFYLGFHYYSVSEPMELYGQRMDTNGNNYWPTYGSGQYGMPFTAWGQISDYYDGDQKFFYSAPYLYVFYCVNNNPVRNIYIQALDSLGNWQYGTNGQLFSSFPWPWGPIYINPFVDESSDVTVVFEYYRNDIIGGGGHDVWAKRMYADGTLGGPNAPIDEVTISVSGNDVVLTWPSMALNADYKIYKSAIPYFQPVQPDTVISDTVFVDIGAILGDSCFYCIGWNPH